MIETLDKYRHIVDELVDRYSQEPRVADLVREIEQILQFESDHKLPEGQRLFTRLSALRHMPGQRTAIISDIHGNYEGLCIVLEDIERQNCDRIVCLGDLVEGGPENETVIDAIRKRQIPCVRGNHDENNDIRLSDEAQLFLSNLPERITEEDVLYIHISPRSSNRKINHAVEAWNVFDEFHYRLVFVGHAHTPFIFGERSESYGEATRHPFEYNQPFHLSADDRYIVAVGSIGYGRDDIGKIRYAIFDHEEESLEHRAVEGPLLPFDYSLI